MTDSPTPAPKAEAGELLDIPLEAIEREAVTQRAIKILAEFHQWTDETGPCPIGIIGPWANKLAALCQQLAAKESELGAAQGLLAQIAQQKRISEMTAHDFEEADFETAYDMCVETARAALQQSKGDKG